MASLAVDRHAALENLLSTRAMLVDMGQPVDTIDEDIRRLCAVVALPGSGEVKTENTLDRESDDDDFSHAIALSFDEHDQHVDHESDDDAEESAAIRLRWEEEMAQQELP